MITPDNTTPGNIAGDSSSTTGKQAVGLFTGGNSGAAGLFVSQKAGNPVEGAQVAGANVLTATLAAPLCLIGCPVAGATEGSRQGDVWHERTTNALAGFGVGIVKGVAGAVVVPVAGTIYAANGLREGTVDAGVEHTVQQVDYVTSRSFTDIALNKTDEGDGKSGSPSPTFFTTTEPKSVVHAAGFAVYNSGKGVVSGATLMVGQPLRDIYKGAQNDGLSGSVSGLGSGVSTGVVGGATLMVAGAFQATIQVVKGLTSSANITSAAKLVTDGGDVIDRASKDTPIGLVGLDDSYLTKKQRTDEEKVGLSPV